MLFPRPKVVSELGALFFVTQSESLKWLCYIKDDKAKLIKDQPVF